jgi:molybdopterin-biosynthesis enzyme MoeA-like protein
MNSSRIERLLIEYSSIPERRREIEIKLKETELFKQNATDTLKVPVFDGMPHSKQMQDLVYKAVQKILDEFQVHLDYYTRQLKLYNYAEATMYNALKCLEPHEYNIIYWRYIKGHTWEIVSMKTNYCEKQCRNIKDISIEKLAQNYKE